ncbi:putative transactivator factor [Cestrum yellow leaf curling virus]|uniref:Transactivator/viroplasmin protein n=1 Tax=Cestrum yellow leaf curling virus TaxID=175814 RepID=IBMP_CYLCV|nr:TAV [Cestrum yellow leaf curling virus]Q7TBL3.1 RecName: Full=Transactivator/viroplasmin protein; Short=Tav; AltName: Full=Inclusion body matrix protein [Cestrum yellow leaf curling virus]AAP82459.1 putative transactivator factor [Cestrum yellow leaf curling virus]
METAIIAMETQLQQMLNNLQIAKNEAKEAQQKVAKLEVEISKFQSGIEMMKQFMPAITSEVCKQSVVDPSSNSEKMQEIASGKKPIAEGVSATSPEQTATGKDISKPLMADALPKSINSTNVETSPVQTVTGKDSSKPLMADALPKSINSVKTETGKKSWADIATEDEREPSSLVQLPLSGKKFYVLFNTPRKGIFSDWSQIAPLITGVKGAVHKSYPTMEAAKKALKDAEQMNGLKASSLEKLQPRVPAKKRQSIQEMVMARGGFKQNTPQNTYVFSPENRTMVNKKIFEWKKDEPNSEFYPIEIRGQTKIVLFPGADPVFAYTAYLMGYVKQIIIFEEFKFLSCFPRLFANCVEKFYNKIGRRETVINVRSSFPLLDETMKIRIPAINVAVMAMFNKQFEPFAEEIKLDIQLEDVLASIEGVYERTQKIDERSKLKVWYQSDSTILFGTSPKEIEDVDIRSLLRFEEMFKAMETGPLVNLQDEERKILCQKMQKYKGHSCQLCKSESSGPQTSEEGLQESEDEDFSVLV